MLTLPLLVCEFEPNVNPPWVKRRKALNKLQMEIFFFLVPGEDKDLN